MLLVFELYRRCKCVFHDNLAVVCACVCVFDAPIVVNIYIYISINDACMHARMKYCIIHLEPVMYVFSALV